MLAPAIVLLCLGFLVGAFATAAWWGWLAIATLGLTLAYLRYVMPRLALPLPFAWRTSPLASVWLLATGLALFAFVYSYWRVPTPGPQDISHVVQASAAPIEVRVTGKVTTFPRMTRSQKRQFQLQAMQVSEPKSQEAQAVTGQLYVTVPAKQAIDIYPSQTVAITGTLYRPRRAALPRGFDFSDYLTRSGIFAGLSGKQVTLIEPGSQWGLWAIRQRMIQAHRQRLGDPEGAIVSAMVLGGRTVDIPFDLRDQFTQVGLAHALAASGFHVSLVLALTLAVTQALTDNQRATVGVGVLLLFGALSGFSPSVSRAVLMGIAGLLALVRDRKTRPVLILLMVAVFLLLLNPMWAWDWGFQYSFLATFGLLVTLKPLLARLGWLPPTLATVLAVPLAATLWTLPLQLYYCGWVPIYGLVANILATPFLSILTLGGFISGWAALVWPAAGSLMAWVLYYPAHLLIGLIQLVASLPGSTFAVGTLSIWQMVALYSLFLTVWLWSGWPRYWPWLASTALLIIVIPVWQVQLHRFQVTMLDVHNPPIMLIQQPEGTILINSGNPQQASLSVVPFLQRQGINRVDLAIATDSWPHLQAGWQTLLQHLPVTQLSTGAGPDAEALTRILTQHKPRHPVTLAPLQMQQTITLGQVSVTLLRTRPTIVQLEINQHHWLLVRGSQRSDQAAWLSTTSLPPIDVLWWVGGQLSAALVERLQPELILAATQQPIAQLQQQFPQLDWQFSDGALQWTPEQGAQAMVPPSEQTAEVF